LEKHLRVASGRVDRPADFRVAAAAVEIRRLERVRVERDGNAAASTRFVLRGAEESGTQALAAQRFRDPQVVDAGVSTPREPVDTRDELIAFYAAADVMLVTPLRDGMNLVAKEYVACRNDLGGALVLSEFTGAAAELRQAYLTNPHDLEGVKDSIEAALDQSPEEGRRRMRALRRQVLAHDVNRWARAFLDALAATRVAEPARPG